MLFLAEILCARALDFVDVSPSFNADETTYRDATTTDGALTMLSASRTRAAVLKGTKFTFCRIKWDASLYCYYSFQFASASDRPIVEISEDGKAAALQNDNKLITFHDVSGTVTKHEGANLQARVKSIFISLLYTNKYFVSVAKVQTGALAQAVGANNVAANLNSVDNTGMKGGWCYNPAKTYFFAAKSSNQLGVYDTSVSNLEKASFTQNGLTLLICSKNYHYFGVANASTLTFVTYNYVTNTFTTVNSVSQQVQFGKFAWDGLFLMLVLPSSVIKSHPCSNGVLASDLSCVVSCTGTTSLPVCYDGCPYFDLDSLSCVSVCPAASLIYVPAGAANGASPYCLKACPYNTYKSGVRCLSDCEGPKYEDADGHHFCMSNCTANTSFPIFDFTNEPSPDCAASCAYNTYSLPGGKFCDYSCPADLPILNLADKHCMSQCPGTKYLYYNNSLPTCIADCTNLFKMADADQHLCLDKCPQGYFTKEDDSTCYAKCPAFNYLGNSTCVTTCPSSSYSYLNECRVNCTGLHNYIGDVSTNDCVDSCPNTKYLYFTPEAGHLCANACPSQWHTYAPTSLHKTCVRICPYLTILDGNDCVKFCPNNNKVTDYTSAAGALPGCVNNANNCNVPGLTAVINSKTVCLVTCISGVPYKWTNPTTTKDECLASCPLNTYLLAGSDGTLTCVDSCSGLKSYHDLTRTQAVCVSSCPTGSIQYQQNSKDYCDFNCPTPKYRKTASGAVTCQASCTDKTYAVAGNNYCVAECPKELPWDLQSTCVDTCAADKFYDVANKACISTCSSFVVNNNQCIAACDSQHYVYVKSGVSYCLLQCPVTAQYIDQSTSPPSCKDSCTAPAKKLSGDSFSVCIQHCPPYKPFYLGGQCLASCPAGTLRQAAANNQVECINSCANGKFQDKTTNTCVDECPQRSYINASTCLKDCSSDPAAFWFHDQQWKCSTVCNSPNHIYQYNSVNYCLKNCPLYDQSNNCVRQCATSTYPLKSSSGSVCSSCLSANSLFVDATVLPHVCSTDCPPDNLKLVAGGVTYCAKSCPLIKSTDSTCLASGPCPNGYYQKSIANGVELCTNNCTQTSSLRVHDFDSNLCVSFCPANKFELVVNGQAFCYSVCPTTPAYFNDRSNVRLKCSLICGDFTSIDQGNKYCDSGCPANRFLFDGSCVETCPAAKPNLITLLGIPSCVLDCPNFYFKQLGTCVAQCPSGEYAFFNSSGSYCVSSCDQITLNMKVDYTKTYPTCAAACPSYSFQVGSSCLSRCPNGKIKDLTATPPICVSDCQNNYKLVDQRGSLCVASCPLKYISNKADKVCQIACANGFFPDYDSDNLFTCVAESSCTFISYASVAPRCATTCTQPFVQLGSQCAIACNSSLSFMRIDPTVIVCVSVCPDNTFTLREGLRVCFTTCPSSAPYISVKNCVASCLGSELTYQNSTGKYCMQTCPDAAQFIDKSIVPFSCRTACLSFTYKNGTGAGATCLGICPNPLYNDQTGSYYKCSTACIAPSYSFSQSNINYCLAACPAHFFDDLASYTCVQSCPSNSFLSIPDGSSVQCVTTCDPLIVNTVESPQTCVPICPSSTFLDQDQNGKLRCLSSCSSPRAAVDLRQLNSKGSSVCLSSCPSLYYTLNSVTYCVSQCPPNFNFRDSVTEVCLSMCPSNLKIYNENGFRFCVQACPTPLFVDNTVSPGLCTEKCPSTSFLAGRSCLNNCSSANLIPDATGAVLLCVSACSSSQALFTAGFQKYCVLTCWGSTPFMDISQKPNICLASCKSNTFSFNDNLLGKVCLQICPDSSPYFDLANPPFSCLNRCPSNAYLYNDSLTLTCVLTCPVYAAAIELSTRTCVSICSEGLLNLTLVSGQTYCVSNCSIELPFNDLTSQLPTCVQECSDYSYQMKNLQGLFCLSVCTANQPIIDTSTSPPSCVSFCLPALFLYSDGFSRFCMPACPTSAPVIDLSSLPYTCNVFCSPSLFQIVNSSGSFCISKCPSSKPYIVDSDFGYACQEQCPANTFLVTNSTGFYCVLSCPGNLPFADSTLTPSPCVHACSINTLTYLSTCVTSCPSDSPVMDQSVFPKLCVTQCSPLSLQLERDGRVYCLLACPSEQPFQNEGFCLSSCQKSFLKNVSGSYCVDACPFQFPINDHVFNSGCVSNCSPPNFLHTTSQASTCSTSCPSSAPIIDYSKLTVLLCQAACPPSTYLLTNTTGRFCVLYCPISFPISDNTLPEPACVTACTTSGSLLYIVPNGGSFCQTSCPQVSPYIDRTLDVPSCVAFCSQNSYLYNTTLNPQCLTSCPPAAPIIQTTSSPQTCVSTCLSSQFLLDSSPKRCVVQCPSSASIYDFTQNVPKCSNVCSGFTYLFNGVLKCLNSCPQEAPLQLVSGSTSQCLRECPASYVIEAKGVNILSCQTSCSQSNPWQDQTQSPPRCVATCPSNLYPTFIDSTHKYCYSFCTNNARLLDLTAQRPICVASCSASSFLLQNSTGLYCITKCPADEPLFTVTDTVPTCIKLCPPGYYPNYPQNSPPFCATNCKAVSMKILVSARQCVPQCSATHFIVQDQFCYDSCPSSLPLAVRINSPATCVAVCPSFLQKINDNCECNIGSYYSERACVPCVKNCQYCQSIVCQRCNPTFIVGSNGQCLCGYGFKLIDGKCVPTETPTSSLLLIKDCEITSQGANLTVTFRSPESLDSRFAVLSQTYSLKIQRGNISFNCKFANYTVEGYSAYLWFPCDLPPPLQSLTVKLSLGDDSRDASSHLQLVQSMRTFSKKPDSCSSMQGAGYGIGSVMLVASFIGFAIFREEYLFASLAAGTQWLSLLTAKDYSPQSQCFMQGVSISNFNFIRPFRDVLPLQVTSGNYFTLCADSTLFRGALGALIFYSLGFTARVLTRVYSKNIQNKKSKILNSILLFLHFVGQLATLTVLHFIVANLLHFDGDAAFCTATALSGATIFAVELVSVVVAFNPGLLATVFDKFNFKDPRLLYNQKQAYFFLAEAVTAIVVAAKLDYLGAVQCLVWAVCRYRTRDKSSQMFKHQLMAGVSLIAVVGVPNWTMSPTGLLVVDGVSAVAVLVLLFQETRISLTNPFSRQRSTTVAAEESDQRLQI